MSGFFTLSDQVIYDCSENWIVNFFALPFFLDYYLREKRLDVLVFSSSAVTPTFLTKDNSTASAQG